MRRPIEKAKTPKAVSSHRTTKTSAVDRRRLCDWLWRAFRRGQRLDGDAPAKVQIGDETGVFVLLQRAAVARLPLPVPLRPRARRQQFRTHRAEAAAFALGG